MTRIAVAFTAILVALSACRSSPSPESTSDPPPRIQLNTPGAGLQTIDVLGLSKEELLQLAQSAFTEEEWATLFRVAVTGGSNSADQPGVLGRYTIANEVVRFTPQFPFDPGQRYEASFDPSRVPSKHQSGLTWRTKRLDASIEVPAPERHPTTRVVEVFPSAEEVPENLLRLYVLFSAPMGLAGGTAYVHLLDDNGRTVGDPFLPLDVDLWNEERTRYTVLFDPGRVKRGILPNEEMGRSLVVGQTYTLGIDGAWLDSAGQPLIASFRRNFKVGPAEENAIEPQTWQLKSPAEGTSDPLVVTFPLPLDYGLLQRALTVSTDRGVRLQGRVRLEAGERRWSFTPDQPWRPGAYELHASSILEDRAGNRIGRPFEVDALANGRLKSEAQSATLPFSVAARPR